MQSLINENLSEDIEQILKLILSEYIEVIYIKIK